MNRSGNAYAVYLMIVLISLLGFGLIANDYLLKQVGNGLNTTLPDGHGKDVAMDLMVQGYGLSSNIGDYIVITVLVVYYIGIIIYNYRVAFTPALMYVQVVLFVITLLVGGIMTDAFTIYLNSTFNETALLYPKTVFVMNNLAWFILAGIGVSIFSATQGGGGNNGSSY